MQRDEQAWVRKSTCTHIGSEYNEYIHFDGKVDAHQKGTHAGTRLPVNVIPNKPRDNQGTRHREVDNRTRLNGAQQAGIEIHPSTALHRVDHTETLRDGPHSESLTGST
jgi:hypothetical protein